jgi:hypothetical protein
MRNAIKTAVLTAVAAIGFIPAAGLAQGVLCLGPIPAIGVQVTPIPNLCPGQKVPLTVSGTVGFNYTGTFTLGTLSCALGIPDTPVQVTNGKYSASVVATGPGFARTDKGYTCTFTANAPQPPTVKSADGRCVYPVNTSAAVVPYNMKKPANC